MFNHGLISKVFPSLVSDMEMLFDSERKLNRGLSGVLLNCGQLVDGGFIYFRLYTLNSLNSQANCRLEVFLLFPLLIELIVVLFLYLVFLIIFFKRGNVIGVDLDVVVIVQSQGLG
jgi:hypothetical protein